MCTMAGRLAALLSPWGNLEYESRRGEWKQQEWETLVTAELLSEPNSFMCSMCKENSHPPV